MSSGWVVKFVGEGLKDFDMLWCDGKSGAWKDLGGEKNLRKKLPSK